MSGYQEQETRRIVLDLSGVVDLEQVHDRIEAVLDPPDYYGRNLDALWDILGEIVDPTILVIDGVTGLRQHLGETAESVLDTFMDAAEENEDLEVIIRGEITDEDELWNG